MRTKFIKIELEPNADGSVLTPSQAEDVRQKMYSAIGEDIPEKARQGAREAADQLVAELLSSGPAAFSAKSVIAGITECTRILDSMPRAVRAIARSLDTPSHIFELGGAASELIAAQGFLEMAKTSLEDYLKCNHCKATTEPEEPKGPLS